MVPVAVLLFVCSPKGQYNEGCCARAGPVRRLSLSLGVFASVRLRACFSGRHFPPLPPPLLIHPLYSCLRRATSRIRLGQPQSARLNVVVAVAVIVAPLPLLDRIVPSALSLSLSLSLCDGIHHNPVSMAASSARPPASVRHLPCSSCRPDDRGTRLVIRPTTTLLRFVASVATKTAARCFPVCHFF